MPLRCAPDRCVPEQIFLGQSVPWTMLPFDDAPLDGVSPTDECVLTLGRIQKVGYHNSNLQNLGFPGWRVNLGNPS